MRKRISAWAIVMLLLLALFISQLALPGYAAKKLRAVLEQETESIEQLNIDIATFPALKILTGRIDHVLMESVGLKINKLYLDTFNVSYRDIVLQSGGFIGINTKLEAVISEKAINEYIQDKYPDLEGFHLKIQQEQVLLQGAINFFETKFQLQLSGNFIINDKQQIYFVPNDFQIENIKIPVELLKSYIENINFSFDLEELDIPLDIREIKLKTGSLIISGGVLEKGRE